MLSVAHGQVPARAQAGRPLGAEPGERYRVRLVNRADGAVEISGTGGASWEPLGRVTRPATAAAASTSVLSVAAPGTVAGAAGEYLLLRLPAERGQLRSLRIVASGEATNTTTIATDIPARGPLFRLVAPPVGSRVLLEREGQRPGYPAGGTRALPAGYVPREGDALVIVARGSAPGALGAAPAGEPPTITIENRAGGEVVYAAPGAVPQVLAAVKQPLRGIGRYAGTERAGSGRVLAWSPVTVLVGTAGTTSRVDEKGQPREERGGFVIQPAEPQLRGATHPASQVLLEALPEGQSKPAVARLFGLGVPLSSGDPLDPAPTRVDVRIDGGEWEPFPDLRGSVGEAALAAALAAALGGKRTIKSGITHLRLVYGTDTEASLRRRLRLAATPLVDPPQRGRVTISANVMGEGVAFVRFYLDGAQVQITNLPPYSWVWDTTTTVNGEHLVEIQGLDTRLVVVSTVTTRVLVDN